MPVITDSKKYEETYRKRLFGMSRELRSMIDHASSIVADEFGRQSLLDAKEKALIILIEEIMKLSNRRMAYELPLLGITRDLSYKINMLHVIIKDFRWYSPGVTESVYVQLYERLR